MSRGDPKGHELTAVNGAETSLNRGFERVGVWNDVVGWSDQQNGIRIFACDIEGGSKDRRRSIAAFGFDHNRAGVDADLLQLLGHDEPKIGVGDHDGRREIGACHTKCRALE